MDKWIWASVLLIVGIVTLFSVMSVAFGQISDSINQGIDVTGNMVTNMVDQNVPLEGAGQASKDGFIVLKQLYGVFRSVHHFIMDVIQIIMKYSLSPDEIKQYAAIVEIGGIITTVVLGLSLFKGIMRGIIVGVIIAVMLIIAVTLLNHNITVGFQ